MTDPLRDWWDSLSELDQFNAYRIEKSNADALALTREPGLDVERLALAIATVEEIYPPRYSHDARAHDIAATYAALASEDRP